MTLIDQL